MASKKSNKTEHVLKLITKNQDGVDEAENAEEVLTDQEDEMDGKETVPAIEETTEELEPIVIPPAAELKAIAEDYPEIDFDNPPKAEAESVFEFQPELIEKADIDLTDSTKLINLAERLAVELVPEIMARMRVCSCDMCKNDILALALNVLPQKYVTTDSGKQYTMLNLYRNQYETDVIAALTKACVRVKASPRHK